MVRKNICCRSVGLSADPILHAFTGIPGVYRPSASGFPSHPSAHTHDTKMPQIPSEVTKTC